jgi:quercetin dioxygenase-like cupin family protein
MKPSPASRIRTVFFGLAALLLAVVPVFAADYSTGVTSRVLAKAQVTGSGQRISYPVTDRAEVTAMTVELAPGAETGWHKHPVPVYAYVISGSLAVEVEGGKKLSFGAGEAIIEVVDTMHNGKCMGNEPVKLAVFYLGHEGTPNVIRPVPADLTGLK